MNERAHIAAALRFDAASQRNLEHYDPAEHCGFADKADAESKLEADMVSMSALQDILSAQERYGILIVLQGMDTAGKDGAIKHVMSGVNPQGVNVHSFRAPTTEELRHDYLWRCARVLPERGRIGIFNRSHYEDVLVTRVHPELLGDDQASAESEGDEFWEKRYRDINHFERYLARNRIVTIKFFLHLSKEEQRRRLLARLDDPAKQWKFSPSDLSQRPFWEQYAVVYEQMLQATSTEIAPWYVIPADHKWVARLAIADIVIHVLRTLDLAYPPLSDDMRAAIELQRKELEPEQSPHG